MNLNFNINLFKIIIVISLVIIIIFLINYKKYEKMGNLTDCSGVQYQKIIERRSTKLSKMISDLNEKINDLNTNTYTNIAKKIDSEYYKRQLFVRIPNIRLEFNNKNGYNLIFDTPRYGDVINDSKNSNGNIVNGYTPGTDFFKHNNKDFNNKFYFESSKDKFNIVRKDWKYIRKYFIKACAASAAVFPIAPIMATSACWKKDPLMQTGDKVLEITENIDNIFKELNDRSITNIKYNKKVNGKNIISFIPSNTPAKNILETKMCITDFNITGQSISVDGGWSAW